MDKRYQVFVSSTYADLQQERQKVIQALMEMDCIPAGMEVFPAADEEQWNFIKRVIDDCDYYIVIIGGRYGSLTDEGISYTEQEYDYACSKGIGVLAFLHERPEDIPLGKSETDNALRARLEAFRDKVSTNRLVKFWRNAPELPGLVALSLSKSIKLHPAVGWVRADRLANEETLSDLNKTMRENTELRRAVDDLRNQLASEEERGDLAGLDDPHEFTIEWTSEDRYRHRRRDSVQTTWGEIFERIAPDLLQHPNDQLVKHLMGSAFFRKLHAADHTAVVQHDDFQTIKVQLSALGLVEVSYKKSTKGDMALFWALTKRGQQTMTRLRTVKASR